MRSLTPVQLTLLFCFASLYVGYSEAEVPTSAKPKVEAPRYRSRLMTNLSRPPRQNK